MILKCSYCSGTMRIDEEGLHEGRPLKVRCPHCKGIGFVGARPSRGAPLPEERASSPGTEASDTTDLSLPPDAFKDFRFPSEEDVSPPGRRFLSAKMRILVWIGASVGIIIIFALLVNLVLPGPPE
jgi:hypothetical protein